VLPDRVYRRDPRPRKLRVAVDGFDKPNGLAFSLDGATVFTLFPDLTIHRAFDGYWYRAA
jgi:sugar lactone lactonase YvrE